MVEAMRAPDKEHSLQGGPCAGNEDAAVENGQGCTKREDPEDPADNAWLLHRHRASKKCRVHGLRGPHYSVGRYRYGMNERK